MRLGSSASGRRSVSKRLKLICNQILRSYRGSLFSPRTCIALSVSTISFLFVVSCWVRSGAGTTLDSSPLQGSGAGGRELASAIKEDNFRHINYYLTRSERAEVFPGANAEHLHGNVGVDEKGRSLWSPQPLTFKMSMDQKRKAHEGYCFNTRVSASLNLDRQVPDYNDKQCLSRRYDLSSLPKADVVIVFHNEDMSALLRSIHSILNRTPPELLGEIILVNDDSNSTSHPWLFHDLPSQLHYLPKTQLIHLTERRGLMMARMAGTELAKSSIVVYLDSHIECTPRWLEPIVAAIDSDPKMMVTPFIHSIDPDSLTFEHGAVSVVGFTWTLGQTHPSRPNDGHTPMPSPVMAGGLFATNRLWFQDDLGGYDPEMRLYGGEEMEIGLKVWRCGGSLYALPCSRVGHIFRTDKFWKGQVYRVPYEEIMRNKLRTAEVWLDEYRDIAKLAISQLPANMSLGSLEQPLSIKEKLKCKSFKWYIENVFPELWVPNMESALHGALRNPETKACVDTLQTKTNGVIGLYPCHGLHGSQALLLGVANGGHLRTAQSNFESCAIQQKPYGVQISDSHCDDSQWTFQVIPNSIPDSSQDDNRSYGLLKLKDTYCLQAAREPMQDKSPYSLRLTPTCDPNDPYQIWTWDQ